MECDAKKATVEHEIGTCRLGCTLAMEFPGLYGGRLPVACWKQLRRDPIGFVCGVLLGMHCSLVLCFVCWLPSALGAWRFSAPLPVLSDVLTDSPLLTIDNSKQRALDLEKAWLGVEACCRQEGFVCLLQRPLAELSLSLKVRGKLLRRLCSRFLDRDC